MDTVPSFDSVSLLPQEPQAQPPVRRGGRPQDPIWDQVLVDDGIMSFLKCVKIVHISEKTHVESVRYYFDKKSAKRPKTHLITSAFRTALLPAKIREFQLRFALWFYTTCMTFKEAEYKTLVAALQGLIPFDIIPNRHQLATTLLDMILDGFRSPLMLLVKGKKATLTTDAYTDVNRKSVINYVLLVEDMAFFLESIYTRMMPHFLPPTPYA